IGSAPSLLSMVSVTSARPSGGREVVPAKTTSSILPPRSDLAPCSPMTQERASTTLDLPDPFGPTTQVMPGSRRSVVAEAKDLKPFSVRLFRCTGRLLFGGGRRTSEPTGPPVGSRGRRSGLDEAGQLAAGPRPLLGHVVDAAGGRAPAQGRQQGRARRARALGDHGDPSVGQVVGGADQSQLQRPAARPPAEADALDPAA